MAATITYTSPRVTITGPYKAFTGSSTATLVTFTSGEAPAAGDVGRFMLWCKDGTTNTGPWQVRRITAATATTATVHDPWIGTPSAGDTFRISSTMDDILAAQPTAGTKTGTSTYAMNCDLELAGAAFLGCADQAIEWVRERIVLMFPFANNCVLQLGQLWGGEGAGVEATNGCRWSVIKGSGGDASIYTGDNVRSASGPVINMFGSLVESSSSVSGWMFQRFAGPSRFIGLLADGVMGGRFYHESSEWSDSRMSGNVNTVVAWSIGATFNRPIDRVFFGQNLAATKNYLTFGGTFRNCTFADSNTNAIRVEGSVGSVINYIDCTEFADSKILDAGSGILNQFRSVNLVTTEANGTALAGVTVRVNDVNDATQGAIQTSNGSGVAAEILALRRKWTDANPSVVTSPFRIRLRKYGFIWSSLNAAIADPIRQSAALLANPDVSQASGTAAAHAGITLTDHGGSPVSWNGKNFGITVTGNLTTNPSLTLDDIKHYLHWHLSQNAAIGGKANGLMWHDLIPMNDVETTVGEYGAVTKGVRVVDQTGAAFPGVLRMQADDGTYLSFIPTADLVVTSTQSGTLLQVYTAGTQTVLASTTGTTLAFTHAGETVDIVAQKAGFLPQRVTGVVLSGTVPQTFTLAQDFNYDAGHGLTYTTSASWSRAGNTLTVPTWGPSVRAVYSLMIDSFISETSLRNTPFNLSMNGPTSLLLINGAEGATDASITNMTGGGVRYLAVGGATTADFVGVLSSGVVAGSQARYDLGSTGTYGTTRATGDVNEVFKTYGDVTHGNFDRRNHFQFKVQRNGYRQAEYDIIESYGITSMEPTLYIIVLVMPEIVGLTLGDPLVTGLTLVKEASPVAWDAGDGLKDYSLTITDSGTNTGDDILRWLNYFLSLTATFQGRDPFEWPELVLDNGPSFETLRGVLHGTAEGVYGVRVLRAGAPHPDFARFQADNGTYGIPPVLAQGLVAWQQAGSGILVYNRTRSTVITNAIEGGTSWGVSYVEGTGFGAGDVIEAYGYYVNGATAKRPAFGSTVATSSGWSISLSQTDWTEYNTAGISGASVTECVTDYANVQVDVDTGSNSTTKARIAAFIVYAMFAEATGRLLWFDVIRYKDAGNAVINTDVAAINVSNERAGTMLNVLDAFRLESDDGSSMIASSTYGIRWDNAAAAVVVATGSGVLPADIVAIGAEVERAGGMLFGVRDLVEADEIHTATTVEKRLRGTATVLLTKNHTGAPLTDFAAVDP